MDYQRACTLRLEAERGNEPGLYLDAAQAFEEMGMKYAAQRCRDRANMYLAANTVDDRFLYRTVAAERRPSECTNVHSAIVCLQEDRDAH